MWCQQKPTHEGCNLTWWKGSQPILQPTTRGDQHAVRLCSVTDLYLSRNCISARCHLQQWRLLTLPTWYMVFLCTVKHIMTGKGSSQHYGWGVLSFSAICDRKTSSHVRYRYSRRVHGTSTNVDDRWESEITIMKDHVNASCKISSSSSWKSMSALNTLELAAPWDGVTIADEGKGRRRCKIERLTAC